jgi:multicomponent Na+:H+ antiporter subunit F
MSDLVFYAGVVWVAVLLGIVVVSLARARTTAQRILALDLLSLVLIGLLALAAGEDQRSYALDAGLALALLGFVATLAACRYYESRRPFS